MINCALRSRARGHVLLKRTFAFKVTILLFNELLLKLLAAVNYVGTRCRGICIKRHQGQNSVPNRNGHSERPAQRI